MTTLIGYGSPNKAGTHDVHGAALGEPETEETRSNLGWKYPPFELPDGVKETMSRVEEVGPVEHPHLLSNQSEYVGNTLCPW